MNKEQLRKIIGYHVRLRPQAARIDELGRMPRIDDDWLVQEVTDSAIKLLNTRTSHQPVLGLDHIRSYTSDPQRDKGSIKFGFLALNVQLTLKGNDVLTDLLSPTERTQNPADDPYTDNLERLLRQVLFYEMTLTGRHLLRELFKRGEMLVGTPFYSNIEPSAQNEQLRIAVKRGIVQRSGNVYRINGQFQTVLQRVLFEQD